MDGQIRDMHGSVKLCACVHVHTGCTRASKIVREKKVSDLTNARRSLLSVAMRVHSWHAGVG